VKVEGLNGLIREFFRSLEGDGYGEQEICSVTMGAQARPTYDNFVKHEKNLGIKPLSRIFDNLGYDLHLVPIKKDDSDKSQNYHETTMEFITDSNLELRHFFENKPPPKKRSGRKRVVSSMAEKRAKQLVAEVISKNAKLE
jgi:hypothetical protein